MFIFTLSGVINSKDPSALFACLNIYPTPWHCKEAVTIYGSEIDLTLWNNTLLLMTRDRFGKGSPLISLSDINVPPKRKKKKKWNGSKYQKLKCNIMSALTVTNSRVSLHALDTCFHPWMIHFSPPLPGMQWIKVTWSTVPSHGRSILRERYRKLSLPCFVIFICFWQLSTLPRQQIHFNSFVAMVTAASMSISSCAVKSPLKG